MNIIRESHNSSYHKIAIQNSAQLQNMGRRNTVRAFYSKSFHSLCSWSEEKSSQQQRTMGSLPALVTLTEGQWALCQHLLH